MTQENQLSGFTEFVFLREILFQSRIAIRAADNLVNIGHGLDHIDTWSSIQLILISAGNVSKILWPTHKASAPRGARLRTLLGIDDNNPLADRRLRNHFEHYDERIETWFASKNSAIYKDLIMGPLQGYDRQFPSNVHRGYDNTTQTLTFRGESMNLGAVIKALTELQQKC
jgi:hypothetical protein